MNHTKVRLPIPRQYILLTRTNTVGIKMSARVFSDLSPTLISDKTDR